MAALFIFDELQRRDISKQLVFRDRLNHLDYLTDGKIRERYRLPRLYLLQLVALVSCDLKKKIRIKDLGLKNFCKKMDRILVFPVCCSLLN